MDKKDILIAVSGSIAAFRACELVRNLTKEGYPVSVIMTQNATKFIGPITFEALTGKKVQVDEYEQGMAHIDARNRAAVIAVVPATANIIAKMANGIADDLVTSTYLAAKCPVLVAPAMNPNMFTHPATQRNLARLKEDGVIILDPQEGVVVCGDEGYGKLADVPVMQKKILELYLKTSK
ncbi:phosphopantothenoylcysteine decarboxylase [Leptospira hartskeerlii]|uniref:Phosphopantothenoylcysteine decarboxylase n=3 Tax=Leptospira TaxID=171 RepID=A0A4Z1AQH6_9LEPT|nr:MULTISPECIES: phosphopantothenoylcysteine decarboxylase [Leptospira]PJZ24188.1 phosphopantothenoylcysteine decarboxylase [Leptospira hartskeerlii]PJZ35182.1 phosphopantothenoylcysteine decarboxylase [Leptospira hartskeerlii]PKA17927.1 phosphopantothenoylcysteine decarboxylase [Leptospira haakeii]PKA21652.1 phosphopantothenoylcysteine decarboxylase [Leptospira haakeii]TGM97350.1 phosphopantothenoylcysteine decarboxylase [Leptospira dzoumogneensis]